MFVAIHYHLNKAWETKCLKSPHYSYHYDSFIYKSLMNNPIKEKIIVVHNLRQANMSIWFLKRIFANHTGTKNQGEYTFHVMSYWTILWGFLLCIYIFLFHNHVWFVWPLLCLYTTLANTKYHNNVKVVNNIVQHLGLINPFLSILLHVLRLWDHIKLSSHVKLKVPTMCYT